MNRKQVLALVGALVTAVAMTAASAASAGATKVTVRVEGKSRTLLQGATVTPHGGKVTVSGKSCPAASGAGAVALATHGSWAGKWFSFGLQVEKILGETADFTTTKTYWELFVDDRASQSGICDVKLHQGEQILFADVPATGTEYPLALTAPARASAGKSFTVTVKGFDAKGTSKPLAGATVAGHTTDGRGQATVSLSRTTTLTATAKGYVRAEALVRVS